MPDLIPDLWGDEIGVDALSPVMILNTQAVILEKKTNGLVAAELIRRRFGTVTELTFDIKSKAARHRSRVLVCRHLDDNVYPVWVTSVALSNKAHHFINQPDSLGLDEREWLATDQADGQNRFIEVVSMIFTSREIRSQISSMIARINEAKYSLDRLTVDENLTTGEPIQ